MKIFVAGGAGAIFRHEIFPNHRPDDRANDYAGDEIRKPMDGHGDADSDIGSIKDCQTTQPSSFREKRECSHGHGESNGGVRRRPAPENSTAQPAKVENVTAVRADVEHGMGTTRNCFVGNNDQCAEKFSLSDGPAR